MSVLLLEKSEFPRDKPCGGGVNVRTARILPYDVAPVVERTIYGLRASIRQASEFTLRSTEPLSYLTQRLRLDAYMAEQAVSYGAILQERAAVREIERRADHVVVRAAGRAFEGRALVAADGANGRTARLAGLSVERTAGVAIEGNIVPAGGVPSPLQDTLGLDVGSPPGGYGWIFPKGDHVNIGVGGWRHIGPSLRPRLDELTRYYRYDPRALTGVRGHLLPMRRANSVLANRETALVGDAAGLLDPLTGEGVYSAVWSGQAVAPHIADFIEGRAPDLLGYAAEVERVLVPELELALQYRDLFHLSPDLLTGLVHRRPAVWRAICRLLRGECTYLDWEQRLGPLSLVTLAVSNLVRDVPQLRRRVEMYDPPRPARLSERRARLARAGRAR